MGEHNYISWQKMVLSKSNNEWSSSIKSEHEHVDYDSLGSSDSGMISETPISYPEVTLEVGNNMSNQFSIDDEEGDNSGELLAPTQRRRSRGSISKVETPEERAARLAKMSAYASQRLKNETPEQRSARLRRMSEYAARRLSQETKEQRAKRLARMSAYAAKRLSQETPEQRAARLARMSAYAARRHATKKRQPQSTSSTVKNHS